MEKSGGSLEVGVPIRGMRAWKMRFGFLFGWQG